MLLECPFTSCHYSTNSGDKLNSHLVVHHGYTFGEASDYVSWQSFLLWPPTIKRDLGNADLAKLVRVNEPKISPNVWTDFGTIAQYDNEEKKAVIYFNGRPVWLRYDQLVLQEDYLEERG